MFLDKEVVEYLSYLLTVEVLNPLNLEGPLHPNFCLAKLSECTTFSRRFLVTLWIVTLV